MKEVPYLYRKFLGFLELNKGLYVDKRAAERNIPPIFRVDKKDVKNIIREMEELKLIKRRTYTR